MAQLHVAVGRAAQTRQALRARALAAVFGGSAGLHWSEAAARLAERFPDRWDGAEARAHGVPSVNVKMGDQVAKGCRLADVESAADGS